MDCQEEIQNEFLQQNNNEFVKEEYSDVQNLTVEAKTKEPKPFSARMTVRNIYYSSDSYSSGSDCEAKVIAEEDSDVQNLTIPQIEAKTVQTKEQKPFSARMTIRNIYYSSDSYSSGSESDSGSDCETKDIVEEDSEVHNLTIPKIEAKTADTKEPKPFSARMTIRNIYYSSDSYSSGSDSDSGSDCETKVIAGEDSEVQNLTISKIEAKIADTKAPKPFSARMTTRNIHYSSDSDSYFSDSDSDTIAEEEYKLQKETSPKDTAIELEFKPNAAAHEEEKTPAEPEEALDFDPNKPMLVQTAKSSTTDPNSRPNVLASSILVKHGTKRPEDAGDKDSKRARTTQE